MLQLTHHYGNVYFAYGGALDSDADRGGVNPCRSRRAVMN